jgi:hypothetical protein
MNNKSTIMKSPVACHTQNCAKSINRVTSVTVHRIPLISLSPQQVQITSARIRPANCVERSGYCRALGTKQPCVARYITSTPCTPRRLRNEIDAVNTWAARVCAVLEDRHGPMPFVNGALIRTCELLAKELLANADSGETVRSLDAIQSAKRAVGAGFEGVAGQHLTDEVLLLKVLATIIALSVAIKVVHPDDGGSYWELVIPRMALPLDCLRLLVPTRPFARN